MLIKRLSVLAIACAIGFVPARSFGQASMGGDREQEVLKAESELNQAEIHADADAMDRLFADNYTHTHSTGMVQPKADFINGFKTGQRKYDSIEIMDSKVRFYSETVAVITGHMKLGSDGNPPPPQPATFLEVWVNNKGTWQCAASSLVRPPAKK